MEEKIEDRRGKVKPKKKKNEKEGEKVELYRFLLHSSEWYLPLSTKSTLLS